MNIKDFEEFSYETATVSKSDTGLPYEIRIDSMGSLRNLKDYSPRIFIETDGGIVPVSIESEPKILSDKIIPDSEVLFEWIAKYRGVLISHWNKELTDKEALIKLGR